MKDYGIYEKVKLNGIVPGRLIRHTRADSAIIKSHWHPELEINTVFEGSSRFFINGRIEDVTPSHVVVINSREFVYPFFSTGRDLRYRGYDTNQLRFSKKSDSRL